MPYDHPLIPRLISREHREHGGRRSRIGINAQLPVWIPLGQHRIHRPAQMPRLRRRQAHTDRNQRLVGLGWQRTLCATATPCAEPFRPHAIIVGISLQTVVDSLRDRRQPSKPQDPAALHRGFSPHHGGSGSGGTTGCQLGRRRAYRSKTGGGRKEVHRSGGRGSVDRGLCRA